MKPRVIRFGALRAHWPILIAPAIMTSGRSSLMKKAWLVFAFALCLSVFSFGEYVVGVGGIYDYSGNTLGSGGTDTTTSLHSLGFNFYQFFGGPVGLVIQLSMPIPVGGSSQAGSTITNLTLDTYFMKYVIDMFITRGFPIVISDSSILMPSFGLHLGQLLLVTNGYAESIIDMSLGVGVVLDYFYYFTQNLGLRFGLSGAYDFLAIAAPPNSSYRNGFFISAMADFVIRLTE
jgi:hypothetical protein